MAFCAEIKNLSVSFSGVPALKEITLSLPQEGEAARLFMRVANPERKVKLEVKSGDTLIMSKILPAAKPSEMIALDLPAEKTKLIKGSLTVALNREA